MQASLDFDRSIAIFKHEGEVMKIPLITEGIESGASVENKVTSDYSDGVSSEEYESKKQFSYDDR